MWIHDTLTHHICHPFDHLCIHTLTHLLTAFQSQGRCGNTVRIISRVTFSQQCRPTPPSNDPVPAGRCCLCGISWVCSLLFFPPSPQAQHRLWSFSCLYSHFSFAQVRDKLKTNSLEVCKGSAVGSAPWTSGWSILPSFILLSDIPSLIINTWTPPPERPSHLNVNRSERMC